jgi:hypothetical protein
MTTRTRRPKLAPLLMLGAMLCAASVLTGCNKASHDNVEKWRNTEEGPGRLAGVVADSDVDMDVRAHAAEALISLGKVADVKPLVAAMSAEVRDAFFTKLTPKLWAVAKILEADQAPVSKQMRAKDALFELRPLAEGPRRDEIDNYLLDWLTLGNFYDERAGAGDNTGEKIIRAIGIKAGPKMVQLGQDLLKNQDQGAKGLVPISKTTLEGIAFTGAPEAVLFLTELGAAPQKQEGLQVQAMTALYTAYIITKDEPRPDILGLVPHLDRFKKIAFADDMPGENINIAYELIAAVPAPACLQPLVYLATHRTFVLRLRAIDFGMRCGGPDAIVPLAEALPDGEYQQGIIEKYFVKKIDEAALPRAAEAARTLLGSRAWVARYIGIEILARAGSKADAAKVRALRGDKAKIRGYYGSADGGDGKAKGAKPDPTIGERAAQVADLLEKKS